MGLGEMGLGEMGGHPLRTADNVSFSDSGHDMHCSQEDAPCSHINPRKIQEHIEHCNFA